MAADFSEAKTEVVIDRISGTAKGGGLRIMERIPAGTVFDFSLSLRIYKEEEAAEHKNIILKGMKLLQQDALGGSGSRGYGKIRFFDLTVDGQPFDLNSVTL
jgi:CRISPR-associated protein Csm3